MLNRNRAGFSVIELMVTVSVIAILTALAVPNFTTWIRNSRVRTVADALQSGVRLAQAEAQRRTHVTAFFRTRSKDCTTASTASADGLYWQVRTVPSALVTNDVAEAVQCGVLTDVSTGVSLNSSATVLCFGGDGRQASVTNPAAIGADCTAAAATYDVALSAANDENRPLRVTVSLAGAIRLCDPRKDSSAPDGCR